MINPHFRFFTFIFCLVVISSPSKSDAQLCEVDNPDHGYWSSFTNYDCSYNWTGGSTSDGWCYDEEIIGDVRIYRWRVVACAFEGQGDASSLSFTDSNNCTGICSQGCEPEPNCVGGRSVVIPTFTYSAGLSEWVCFDNCPDDPNKTEPGVCGCGVPDNDSDGDGTPDCNDGCPDDPNKIESGICGCGVPDTDSDGDGTPDCNDNCPSDPNKIEPGICGCDVPDADSDGDGSPDCNDNCPDDPAKIEPGVCGCGVADTDSDGDGTPDCNDDCPDDPNKIESTDSDGDGIPDCIDIDDEDNLGDEDGDC
jgi:hypothetical protein